MKKPTIILVFILFLSNGSAIAKDCYLLIVNPGSYKTDSVFEISSTLIAQFFEPVSEVPSGGVGASDCFYKLTVIEGKETLSVSISGREINSIGNAEGKDLPALQQALLRAIYRSGSKIKPKVCYSYRSILKQECEQKTLDLEVAKAEAYEVGEQFQGIWFYYIEDDEEDFYLHIARNNMVQYCFLKDGDEDGTWTAGIENDSIILDEKVFKLLFVENSLILKGPYNLEMSKKKNAPDECRFHSDEYIDDLEDFEGVWHVKHEDDNSEMFATIDDFGEVRVCELKGGLIEETSSAMVLDGSLYWGDEEFSINVSGNNLVMKSDYTEILEKTDSWPDMCQNRDY